MEILSMKPKLFVLILALTALSWAQSTTPVPSAEQNSTPAKASCPCCEKMASADHKDMDCCKHHHVSGKDGKAMSCRAGKDAKDASCCSGKDAKCLKDDKASSCCGTAKPGEGQEMACCAKDNKNDAKGCCSGNQCGKHDHGDHPTSGN
jgi:hypothetical protein